MGIDSARDETLARLAASRADIRRLLEPPPRASTADGLDGGAIPGAFPRSRTMKMLLSARGAGTVGAVACGLLISRPALALRLLRLVPTGAIGRMILIKAISALRSNQASTPKRDDRRSETS